MYYYVCPYCAPCAQARLFSSKEKTVVCDCKQTIFSKDKECKKQKYKCKRVWRCKKCRECFAHDEEFLKEQKRKIKDG